MKKLVCALLIILPGCTATPPYSQSFVNNQSNIMHLQQSVVSVLHRNLLTGELEAPRCTAFFINETILATAHHCVESPTTETVTLGSGVSVTIPVTDVQPTIGRIIPVMTRSQFESYITSNGTSLELYDTTVVAVDQEHDVALLRLSTGVTSRHSLRIVMFPVGIGERVYAMGMPASQPWILTEGIISAINPVEPELGNIIHQASIAPGASGSPLVNEFGEVVGVNIGIINNAIFLEVAVPIHYISVLLTAYNNSSGL